MEKKGLTDYFNESLDENSDVFAMQIIEGIFREAEVVSKKGELMDDVIARFGALLSSFIETAQSGVKNKNVYEISGFLAAMKFRYVDNNKNNRKAN